MKTILQIIYYKNHSYISLNLKVLKATYVHAQTSIYNPAKN